MTRVVLAAALCALLGLALLAGVPRPAAAAGTMTIPFVPALATTVDGVVGPAEYPATGYYRDSTTGIEVYSAHDDANLSVALVSPGTGWVGIGFGPQGVQMDGANVLIGYVSGSTVVISDEFGIGFEHRADTDLGGRDNLLARGGTESGGRTTLEFRFPLYTGDAYDFRLQAGRTYGLILSYQATADDLVSMHTAAAGGLVLVQPDPNNVPTKSASLTLTAEGAPLEGGNVTLLAEITGDAGIPLVPAEIEFYVNTSVGLGRLAVVSVDGAGRASLNYTFRSPGEFAFLVRFTGDTDYLPAQANLTLAAGARDGAAFNLQGFGVRAIVFAALGGVGVAYLYSMGQVLRIRRIGTRAVAAARKERAARAEGVPKEGAGPSPRGGPPKG